MLASASGSRTWLHRVSPGVKLATLAAATLVFFWITAWWTLGAGLVVILCVYASLGRLALRRLATLRPLVPLLVIVAILQAWVADIETAASIVLRLLLLVLAADLVAMTTPMLGMMDAVAPLLRPLARVGLDARRISLAVALVVRFVPTLFEDWRRREEAWRARTGRRASVRLLVPWLQDLIRLADHVGEALDARGFDAPKRSRH